ncbi:MAG: hypothetical protein AAGB00_00320 [Planctomycetota bacterium]
MSALLASSVPVASLASTGMFALGCALLTTILLRRSYKYFGRGRRRRNEPAIAAQPRPEGAWTGAHADASARVERQKVELHEQSREAAATIDNKLVLLQELIAKSQAQIDRLEKLLAEAEALEPEVRVGNR